VITTGSLASGSTPVYVFVGPANGAYVHDITAKVPLDSIVLEETGTLDEAACSFSIIDKALLYTALRGEWRATIQHGTETVYRGYIGRPTAQIAAIYGELAVSCRDVGSLMDRLVVKSPIIRDVIETDKARIQWLVDAIGQPLVGEGLTDWSNTQVLNAAMATQTFPTRLTLRQAIERVLAAASPSANYYLDFKPSLRTYDRDHPETGHVAPKNVNASTALAGDEIAPSDLAVHWDTDGLVNGYFVQGKNAVASGWYTDADLLPGPWSVYLYGYRQAYIQAPDADTQAKAARVASLALSDTRNPVPRGTFSTVVRWDETRFKGGQLIYVTSAVHGLNGAGADAGPWAGSGGDAGDQIQPLRIVNVTTRYINGSGDRVQEVEFGGRRVHMYRASIPS
jgi:hypothetical protein